MSARTAEGSPVWGREDEPAMARARLLEAAGAVFGARGVVNVTITDVANAAGCTRGTVHRLFGDREALRRAFVDHHASSVAARVAEQVVVIEEPAQLLSEAVLRSVDEVRADPVLSAWFTDASATTAGRLALQADVVRGAVGGLVREVLRRARERGELREGVDAGVVADAVVRLILSLLTLPASPTGRRSAAGAERRLVDQVLVGSVLSSSLSTRGRSAGPPPAS